MAANSEILDLYDVALLLNYERATTEPRFRHTKLREAVFGTASNFETIRLFHPDWFNHPDPLRFGFVFDQDAPPRGGTASDQPRDLPTNMLPTPIPPSLQSLTPKQLETIWWQARAHDGCYKSVTLFQHFFDLFPASTPLRIRLPSAPSESYTTLISTRVILELTLHRPRVLTLSYILPANTCYTTGSDAIPLRHAVLGFANSMDGNITTVLDLSSLQFGDLGRGLGGRSLFTLESLDAFYDRIERIAHGADTENARISARIGPSADDAWLKDVARRAKARWERRAEERWCGHCGAPGKELKKCAACKDAVYCDEAHQAAAWPFHKRFCAGRKA